MAYGNRKRLKTFLRSPHDLGRIYWFGGRGLRGWGRVVAVEDGGAFIFTSEELPADYDKPEYESSNPYKQRSLEIIDRFANGLVVDLGAGNPRQSFDNVCQIEIRRYPDTDIVVSEGRIPLRSGCVDGVVSEAVLEHVKDPFLYVSEIYRVLRPGGEVVLNTAFMQPLHGYPSHYFNTTAFAVRLLFERFNVEELKVGPHQHPWIALHWILTSYRNGLRSDDERATFDRLTLGETLDLLGRHQEMRARVKDSNDPRKVAHELHSFNEKNATTLSPFLDITPACVVELAAGFEVYARKS